ncbi:G5 domain-containing protein, partial [Corynebacterium riegelii]|uniref:G5 domain-containing protein n=1 Tax=Corynebacterium riegelii TaxID=156976 RepID=UPI00254D4A27
ISTAPETAKPGDKIDVPVIVTYEDGSKDNTTATVNVIDVPKREVPFQVEYKYDDTIPAGTYKVETKGEPGKEKMNLDGTWERTQEPKNEVVVIGTKPAESAKDVEWTFPIPYPTEVRENPDLKPGEMKVIQEGENGERKYSAKFTSKGDQASVAEEKVTKEPQPRIIEVGPGLPDQELTSKKTQEVPFEIEYVYDDTLESGKQIVDQKGVPGEQTITSTQKIKDGRPDGEPSITIEETKAPQKAKIRIGTKTTGENVETVKSEVPFGVKIEFDPNMAAGTSEVVTEGVPGEKTVTVKRDITNSKPGDPQVTEDITKKPVDQVIKVGTKPSEASEKVTWTAQVPFEVETRPNPELKPGEIKVVQKGVPGEKTYTADFTAKGDQATVTPEEKQTKNPVNEIIEYGPALGEDELVTTVKKPVPFETEIVFDDSLEEGKQEVKQVGRLGEDTVTSTQKLVDGKPSGDPVVETKRTEEPVKQIIRVGTKTTGTNTETFTTEAPYKVVVKYDPNMPAGESKVTTPGVPGEKTVTIKRDITNSQPGDPTISEEITKQPVDEVITVGTKQATATESVEWKEPIPFGTTLRPNPELKPGETKVVQEGKNGEASYAAVFTGTNGEATVKETKARTEPVERIIEYGPGAEPSEVVTKTEKPVPFETEIVFDDSLEAGEQVVDQQGELGTEVVTSTQKIVDGKPSGDPTVTTEQTKAPKNAKIRVGTKTTGETKKTVESEVPFGVKIEFDPNLPAGTSEVVTEGKPGKKTTTVTQKVTNSQPDGEATVEEKVTEKPVDQVIKVGTKPSEASEKVTWTAQVPFEVETRPNPELKPGEIKVVQKGVPGEKTYTADFTAKGDQATVTPEEKQTKDPVNEIIEYGPAAEDTSVVTKVEKPVPFETEIVFDDSLEEGQQKVDQQGETGTEVVTSTQKIVDGKPSGDPEVNTERTKEPKKQIIRVGTKTTGKNTESVETEVPYDVKVVYDPSLKPGESKVTQEGKPGKKKVTIERDIVNSKPGDPKITEEIIEKPVEKIVTVGTKPAEATNKATWVAPLPYDTIVRVNPELKPGEMKVVQEGEYGEKEFTADFTAKDNTSTVNTTEKVTKQPVQQIIEYGPKADDSEVVTKTEKPVPFETKIVFDPNLKAGEQVVDKQGELGTEVVTSTQKIVDGKPFGEPTVTTERTKEPTNAVIRVGTKANPVSENVEWTEKTPFETEIRVNPNLQPGETNVLQEGTPGEIKHTVKVTVDNGEVNKDESTEKISDPTPRIIEVGPAENQTELTDKHTEEIPYETIVEYDPNLEAGKVEEDQPGVVGEKEVSKTWKLENGEPVGDPETTETVTKEKQDRKIRVGTKCNCGQPSDPSDPSDPGQPGEPGDDKKGSSEKAERCVANAFATNSPLLWMLPIGLLAGIGYGVNEAFGPQIQAASAEINARFQESMPKHDWGFGDQGQRRQDPEWMRELQAQADGINRQFAGYSEQLQPLGIALGVIASLALLGSLIAQACTEEGFDNGMTVWGLKGGSSEPGKRPKEWSSQN